MSPMLRRASLLVAACLMSVDAAEWMVVSACGDENANVSYILLDRCQSVNVISFEAYKKNNKWTFAAYHNVNCSGEPAVRQTARVGDRLFPGLVRNTEDCVRSGASARAIHLEVFQLPGCRGLPIYNLSTPDRVCCNSAPVNEGSLMFQCAEDGSSLQRLQPCSAEAPAARMPTEMCLRTGRGSPFLWRWVCAPMDMAQGQGAGADKYQEPAAVGSSAAPQLRAQVVPPSSSQMPDIVGTLVHHLLPRVQAAAAVQSIVKP